MVNGQLTYKTCFITEVNAKSSKSTRILTKISCFLGEFLFMKVSVCLYLSKEVNKQNLF